MIRFRLISWPYFRRHVLRTVLTTAGVALGVAVFVAMQTANKSVFLAFSETVDRIAGKTELQVTAGHTGFGEEVLEIVQSASTVRVAVPVIEAVVAPRIEGEGQLLVLGIDMMGDRSLRDYAFEGSDDDTIDDPLVFLAQPDSLILTTELAARHRIETGARLPLHTVGGEKTFTVRGIMRSGGLASAFGGNLAVMDIYAAQAMFGRGRMFDRIDLAVKPGITLAQCQRELASRLGPGFTIEPPSARGRHFESLLAGYTTMVSFSSAFALFIGMFIIYHSFAVAVTERRREIGILRALGASSAYVRSLFLAEGAVIGLLGSSAGVVCGTMLAHLITSSVSALIGDMYGVAQRASDATVDPALLATALGTGVVASVASALIPAHAAARIEPLHALQRGGYQQSVATDARARRVLAAGLGAASIACLALDSSRVVFYAGYGFALTALLLITPVLSRLLARAMRPLLQWARPVEGALAADSLIQAPRRTSASVAALMLSLALVVAFSGTARSSVDSIVTWMDVAFNPDLFVLPSQRLDDLTLRFPSAMGPDISRLPGVERVQQERNARVEFHGRPVMAVALEMRSLQQTDDRRPVVGDVEEMYRKAAAGEGLIVSENLAELEHLALGQVLDIPAPYGRIRLPIVGIMVDYSDQQGSILMDRALFTRYWRDDSANAFRVFVTDGVAVDDVRRRIVERFAGQRQVFVLTNDELKRYIGRILDQWFGLTDVQIAVAVLVAVLGIVNSLTVSIIDRRRDLAVLQAVGALRSQVRGAIWIEALAIAAVGLVLGCALGAINLYFMLQISRHDLVGMPLDYAYPINTALVLVPVTLGAGFVAALWPAESAVRASLVEALEYE